MKSIHFLTFLLLLITTCCFGQGKNIVDPEAPTTELHKANIGKIFFTEKRSSNETLKNQDFLKTYKLTNKSNLFLVAFFDNSLTNYQYQLAPQLPPDSIFKLGNYQFAVYIDRKLIYQSNLLPGAPSIKNQNANTYLNRPLVDNINGQGTWSESFWNRFMQNGGDRVLTEGRHLMKMEIRAYVKTEIIKTGEIIASGELVLNVARQAKIDITQIKLNKLTAYNGLEISDLPFDKGKMKYLKGKIEAGVFKKINSVVVLKEGKILVEEYFNGENRNSLHDPRSVGKSFASTMTGIAIDEGFIKSDTQAINQFYQLNLFQRKQLKSMTLDKAVVLRDAKRIYHPL